MDEVLGHEVEALHDPPHQAGPHEPGDSAHEGSHQVVGRDAAELDLEGYDGKGRQDAEPGPHEGFAGHRGIEVSRMGEEGDHEDAEEGEPHGRTFRDSHREPPEPDETRTFM